MVKTIIYELIRIENLRVPSTSELRTSLECRAYYKKEQAKGSLVKQDVRAEGGLDEVVKKLIEKGMYSGTPNDFRRDRFTTLIRPEVTKSRLYSPVDPRTLIEFCGRMRQSLFKNSNVHV